VIALAQGIQKEGIAIALLAGQYQILQDVAVAHLGIFIAAVRTALAALMFSLILTVSSGMGWVQATNIVNLNALADN
jgi:hypothetical protein